MKRPRILVVGSLVMDLIVRTGRFPDRGETVLGEDFCTAAGGKGANQAVQAARLGADVTMVGRVGSDGFGQTLLKSLKNFNVDISHVIVTPDCTSAIGNVQIEATEHGTSNRIIVVPGANMRLTEEDVVFLKSSISTYDMVILQLEIPMRINTAVAKMAHENGVPVMLNTAPYEPVPQELLTMVSYISPNEHEAAHMVGMKIDDEKTARKAVEIMRECGTQRVIITLGGKGAAYGDAHQFFICPSIPNVEVRDPTAAGDSFVGAFCTGICAGMSAKRSVLFANYTASLTISRIGAQPSLPSIFEVQELMKKCGAYTADLQNLTDE